MKKNTAVIGIVVVAIALVILAALRGCGKKSEPVPEIPVSSTATVSTATIQSPAPIELKPKPTPTPKSDGKKPPKQVEVKPEDEALKAPKVEIFKELIPKNIEIVRVYYTSVLAAPGTSIEFDINGTGFTQEFHKMIKVESGQPEAAVKNLALVTPNQIHGTLVISEKSATKVAFPQVLIKDKVVFQAPEPFAVIRPGEVLNLIFTEMGESGRTGRFRVFTNLTPETYKGFKVMPSTSAIQVIDLSPIHPFVVDGTIVIGPAAGGEYGMAVTLNDKEIWRRDGIIRVVKPNVGQAGLIQRVHPLDGFHRPGDKALFAIQGSGFQPEDVGVLKATVKDLEVVASTFTYLAPGRMELALTLPASAPEGAYTLQLLSGSEVLQELPDAFRVVGQNWTRQFDLKPSLTPGATGLLLLHGRDLTPEFIAGFKIESDEPQLVIGKFVLNNPREASAPISVGKEVKSGDYLLKVTSNNTPVNPQFGSIIRISRPK